MVVVEELQDVKSVVVLCRVAVFGGETVIDGDDQCGEIPSESAANGVVSDGICAEEGEAAAVEEDNDGETGSGGNGDGRVETEPEVAGGVYGGIEGRYGLDGFAVGRGFEVQETEETAVDGAIVAACSVDDG